MKNQKFSHKTPHLKGKQHQLDPNLDLKQSVYHATTQYVDWDNDGDVDEYDKKPKLVPDENPNANFATTSKKLIAKQKGELKHTKRGIAYEEKIVSNIIDEQSDEKRYCPMCKKSERRMECSYGPSMWDAVTIGGVSEAKKGPCWTGYKQIGMKKKNGKKVPNCVPEEVNLLVSEESDKVCEVCGKSPCECSPKRPMGGNSAKLGSDKNYVKPMSESVRIPAKTGNIILVTLTWRGKYFAMKMFFPQTTKPSRMEVQDQIDKVYPGSRVQSYYVSDIKPGEQFLQIEGAAWTKKEGQNQEGGLNEKGRKSYEEENPGSDLKAPSKKVGNPRRASFCARMKGMKKKLTSTKTANDPDSRINKSLRAWNC
jgi:hypothetical protein